MAKVYDKNVTFGFCVIFALAHGIRSEEKSNDTSVKKPSFKDRINLNLNTGGASAIGGSGTGSVAHGLSYGFNAGILYPGMKFEELGSELGASTFSMGFGEESNRPSAKVDTEVKNNGSNGIQGSISSEYSGEKGQAYVSSQSSHLSIPLGFGSGVILSNFDTSKNSSKSEDLKSTNSSESSSSDTTNKDKSEHKNEKIEFV